MANLSQKTILLLDKLYNLKGEDNVIIQEINNKIGEINASIKEDNEREAALEQEKLNNQNDLLLFNTQQEAFLTAFSGIDNDTFSSLSKIGVDVNIGSMVSAVSEKAPEYIRGLQEKIAEIQTQIDAIVEDRENLERELDGLGSQKVKAEADRSALISLMAQSLSSDAVERKSLTPQYVEDVLSRFDSFESEEINTLSKLIIFPDDGLLEYDNGYDNRLTKSEAGDIKVIELDDPAPLEVVEPVTKEEPKEEPVEVVEPVKTIPVVDGEVAEEKNGELQDNPSITQIYEKQNETDPTSIIDLTSLNGSEEKEEIDEEPVASYLESLGIDMNRFQEENDKEQNIDQLLSELAATEKPLIANNYELLKSLDAEVAAYRYRRGHSYLTDSELSQKITFLRSKNISEKNIKMLLEQANSGLRESFAEIEDRFKSAEELGTPIDNEHINLLSRDLPRLANNIRLLTDAEITIDEKELRNHVDTLTRSTYVRDDLEVLKNYLINITRSNDKYALGVFEKSPYELITDIDDIIENNQEEVLSTNPEVLASRNGAFVDRVKYFKGLGKPISDPSGKNAYAPYIVNLLEAFRENGNKVIEPIGPTINEVNGKISSIIGSENTTSSLVEILDEYYRDRTDFKDIELSDVATEAVTRLAEMFEQVFHAERVGKYTFKVADAYISKPKLERHLKVLASQIEAKGGSIDGIEKEVLLTAMLYNLRQDEKDLRRLAEACLGFNEENTYGGKAL